MQAETDDQRKAACPTKKSYTFNCTERARYQYLRCSVTTFWRIGWLLLFLCTVAQFNLSRYQHSVTVVRKVSRPSGY
jgi:hypothetical protein